MILRMGARKVAISGVIAVATHFSATSTAATSDIRSRCLSVPWISILDRQAMIRNADARVAACTEWLKYPKTRDSSNAASVGPKIEDVAEAHAARASALVVKGDLKRAVADYNAAIALMPARADYYLWRGRIHATVGEQTRALRDFDKAITLDPRLYELFPQDNELE